MKRFALISTAAAAAALMGTSVASADIMVGSAPDDWHAMPGLINNFGNANRPFWDNRSRDVANPSIGGNENIGDYLEGPFNTTVTGPVTSPGLTPNWWGGTTSTLTNSDLHTHFNRGISDGAITATLLVESTAHASTNVVGWYNADNPTSKTVLWTGAASSTNNPTVIFTPTTNWGFYFVGSQGTYYMDTSIGHSDINNQHFAMFQTDGTVGGEQYIVGVEDLNANSAPPENMGDYNDFIFTFQSTPGGGQTPTPEPTSLAILGIGAVSLLARRRK